MRRARLRTALVASLTALSLALTACGGDEGSDEADQAADPAEEKAEVWPLTGLPVEKGSAEQDHPALVVKMDNTESSAPQVGLGSADLVVEELVEGGVTRLAAFYYSDIPDLVGPVRSMRASDIGIVSPADATVVTSGAAGVTIKRINDAKIPFISEGGAGFHRDESRSAPYNLFNNLGEAAKDTEDGEKNRPDDYLPWGSADDLPKGGKATSVAADFGTHVTNWVFEDGRYVNQNTFAGKGDEFPADSVLVLRAEVGDAGYVDPAGNPVPETKFEGKGEALLFHDGRVVKGTWRKKTADAPLQLTSRKGGDLTVPAGHVWIELVPVDGAGGSVEFAK